MIDLHCHLLDGLNCGPETYTESLEMCRLALADGVQTIVATPRWNSAWDNDIELPLARMRAQLQRLHEDCAAAVSLKSGFLMRYDPGLPQLVNRWGSALTLGGGRYLLIAMPPLVVPCEVEEVWAELARHGYAVIIARPECSPALRQNSARLGRWMARGAIIQLDAASINGVHGREAQRSALRWAQEYETQTVVASNAHDASSRRPSLKTTREELGKRVGAARAQDLFSATPAEVINAPQSVTRNRDKGRTSRVRALATYLRLTRPTKAVVTGAQS